MDWWQNPYKNGERSLSNDIADGVLRYHEAGYVDMDGNIYDIAGSFLYNEEEKMATEV